MFVVGEDGVGGQDLDTGRFTVVRFGSPSLSLKGLCLLVIAEARCSSARASWAIELAEHGSLDHNWSPFPSCLPFLGQVSADLFEEIARPFDLLSCAGGEGLETTQSRPGVVECVLEAVRA